VSNPIVVAKRIDAAFRSDYVRVFDGEDRLFTNIYVDSNGIWYALLYNFNTGLWEVQASNYGDAYTNGLFGGLGWTMYEMHYSTSVCPSVPGIRSAPIRVMRAPGDWPYLDSTMSTDLAAGDEHSPQGCFDSWRGNYFFHVHAANWDWHVHSPNP
jgi:hypothetical protein